MNKDYRIFYCLFREIINDIIHLEALKLKKKCISKLRLNIFIHKLHTNYVKWLAIDMLVQIDKAHGKVTIVKIVYREGVKNKKTFKLP